MKFFFDNCLSPSITNAIRALETASDSSSVVAHLREKFSPSITDPDWMLQLSKEKNWIIISADVRITRTPQNLAALRHSKLTAFFFVKGYTNEKLWDQAWRIIRWWPMIKKQARLAEQGNAYSIPFGKSFGKFKQMKI